jgi:hypothetical protein
MWNIKIIWVCCLLLSSHLAITPHSEEAKTRARRNWDFASRFRNWTSCWQLLIVVSSSSSFNRLGDSYWYNRNSCLNKHGINVLCISLLRRVNVRTCWTISWTSFLTFLFCFEKVCGTAAAAIHVRNASIDGGIECIAYEECVAWFSTKLFFNWWQLTYVSIFLDSYYVINIRITNYIWHIYARCFVALSSDLPLACFSSGDAWTWSDCGKHDTVTRIVANKHTNKFTACIVSNNNNYVVSFTFCCDQI